MSRRLFSCFFPPQIPAPTWRRLSRVLTHTAAAHCEGWEIRIEAVTPPAGLRTHGIPAHVDNTHKLAWWADRVRECADGDQVLLIDADTAILRSLDDIWQQPFDVAYTVRSGFIAPFNAGVVFLRASDRTRAFMDRWVVLNDQIQRITTKPWRKRYGGVNQASLAELLNETDAMGVQLRQLSCREWNCEDSAWAHYESDVTRILHVKSELRRACLTTLPICEPAWKPLISLWRGLEADANAAHKESRTA